MSCDSVSKLIPLYFYGELTPEEEERVDEHVHGCAACEREVERQRRLAAALDRRRVEAPATLLEDCRADLAAAVRGMGRQPAAPQRPSPWGLFLEAVGATFTGLGRYRQPAGAVALVALGFFAARFTGSSPSAAPDSAADRVFSTVRSVQSDNAGRVQIALDETRRRVVSGGLDDAGIQRLLLAAARGENPAVRVESMGMLKEQPDSGEVRSALLNALLHDSNPGVRLKALEGLKPLAGDPEISRSMVQALMGDDNPAIRMQLVDALVERRGDALVGVLQDVVQKEDNGYVRLKCEKALKEMNASVGTF